MNQVKRKAPCTAATMQDAQNNTQHKHMSSEAENQVLFDFLTKKSFIKSVYDLTESRCPDTIDFDSDRYEAHVEQRRSFIRSCGDTGCDVEYLFCGEYAFGYEAGFIQGYLVAASLILTGRFCDD